MDGPCISRFRHGRAPPPRRHNPRLPAFLRGARPAIPWPSPTKILISHAQAQRGFSKSAKWESPSGPQLWKWNGRPCARFQCGSCATSRGPFPACVAVAAFARMAARCPGGKHTLVLDPYAQGEAVDRDARLHVRDAVRGRIPVITGRGVPQSDSDRACTIDRPRKWPNSGARRGGKSSPAPRAGQFPIEGGELYEEIALKCEESAKARINARSYSVFGRGRGPRAKGMI